MARAMIAEARASAAEDRAIDSVENETVKLGPMARAMIAEAQASAAEDRAIDSVENETVKLGPMARAMIAEAQASAAEEGAPPEPPTPDPVPPPDKPPAPGDAIVEASVYSDSQYDEFEDLKALMRAVRTGADTSEIVKRIRERALSA